MTSIRKIGFIGVGHMGSPMAGQLVKKGFDVTAFDLRESALHAFAAEHGGRTAATLADAGRGAARRENRRAVGGRLRASRRRARSD